MKALAGLLAATALAICITAVLLWQQLHDLHAQTAQLRERVTALQGAQLASAMAPGTPAAAAATTTGAPADALQAALAAPPGAGNKQPTNDLVAGITQMLASPEGKELIAAQARMFLPRMYPDLGKTLGLTPAEEQKFFDMLARQQTENSGDALGMLAGGTPPDRATIEERQRKARDRQQANQAEMTAFLGNRYPQWQEYQTTLPARRQVNELQTSLGASKALSDAQSRSLIAAINAEQGRIQQDRRNEPRPAAGVRQSSAEAQVQRVTESNRRLLDVAAPHLTPEQLAGYRRMLEQEESLTRTMVQQQGMP